VREGPGFRARGRRAVAQKPRPEPSRGYDFLNYLLIGWMAIGSGLTYRNWRCSPPWSDSAMSVHGSPFPRRYRFCIRPGPSLAAAGQTVPHLHVHLIPRYDGDRLDARGGVRWIIPEKADYWSKR
jgi:hypothetical protein